MMINSLRSLRLLLAPSGLALALSLAACGPTIELVPSPAETPGVSMGPLISGSVKGTSTITVESHYGFEGLVNLSVLCCQDLIRDQALPAFPGSVVLSLANNSLNILKKSSASTVLNISLPVPGTGLYANLVPTIPFGKYVMRVVGTAQQSGNITDTVNVGVRVMPWSEPTSGCKPGVEVFPFASSGVTAPSAPPGPGILQAQIAAAEASPRRKSIDVAIYRATGPEAGGGEAFRMTIEDSGLPPAVSIVVLRNKSTKDEDKEIVTIPTAGCSAPGKSVVAKKGQTSAQMQLISTQDRTLYFREQVCANFLCTSKVWVDSAIFAEPAFWSVFGGKRVTFEWHECTPVLLWCI